MEESISDKHISFQAAGRNEYQNSLFIFDKMTSITKRKDCQNNLSIDKLSWQKNNVPT